MGEKEGLKTAVELLREQRPDLVEREAAQLSLLPTPAARADLVADDEAAQRSGPGRPPGSRNRRTEQWVDFLMKRYASPLVGLFETFSRPVELLAAELGCTRLEAVKLQNAAREAALPYVHQRLPQAISIDAKSHATLVLDLGGVRPGQVGEDGVMVIEGTIVENQEVSDGADGKVAQDAVAQSG